MKITARNHWKRAVKEQEERPGGKFPLRRSPGKGGNTAQHPDQKVKKSGKHGPHIHIFVWSGGFSEQASGLPNGKTSCKDEERDGTHPNGRAGKCGVTKRNG